MPMKLNVGVSQKVGLPNYGSVGASCNLEMELDASLIDKDLDGFHDRIRAAYVAAHQAVHDELARLHAPTTNGAGSPSLARRNIDQERCCQGERQRFRGQACPERSRTGSETRHTEPGQGDPGNRAEARHRSRGPATSRVRGRATGGSDDRAGERADRPAQELRHTVNQPPPN
jgi:hypothetical protein